MTRHRSTYQHACRVCGAPRWDGSLLALCQHHHHEYMRALHVQTRRNKKAGIILPRGDKRAVRA